MSRIALIVLLAAQAAAPVKPAEPPPISVTMVAVQAMTEGHRDKQFGLGLEEVKSSLLETEHDTFRLICSGTQPAPYKVEKPFEINPKYTIFVKPEEKQPDGRIRLDVRVEMRPRGDKAAGPVNAVKATYQVTPGRRLLLRGLKLEKGELLIVLFVREETTKTAGGQRGRG